MTGDMRKSSSSLFDGPDEKLTTYDADPPQPPRLPRQYIGLHEVIGATLELLLYESGTISDACWLHFHGTCLLVQF